MAKAKYKKIFEEIWDENKVLFQEFFILNSDYEEKEKRREIEDRFQKVGEAVHKLLIEGENDLCRQMEKSSHRLYSSKVADKYWDEIRKYFKYIDLVGVSTSKV